MRKILIAEDDKLLNKTLNFNLTSDGFNVSSVHTYRDAVQYIKEIEFDIARMETALTYVKRSGEGVSTLILFL